MRMWHPVGRAGNMGVWVLVGLALVGCGTASRGLDRAALEFVERAEGSAEAPAKRPQPEQPQAEARAPPEEGEVRLGLFEAFHRALAGNHEIQIAAYRPLLAEEDVVRAKAVFDPSVFVSNTFARSDRPIQSTLDTGRAADARLTQDTWTMEGGVRQPLIVGGEFTLYQQMGYLDTNSTWTLPNPQYSSGLTAELNQPLLKGFGDKVNRAAIRVANLNAGISFEEFRQKVMEVVSGVASTYWQLAFDHEAVRVSRETLQMAREVHRREMVRLRQGISREVDVARAASAAASREAALARAKRRLLGTMDRLKLLLNTPDLPLDTEVRVLPAEALRFLPIEVDRAEAVAKALARRPDLQSARTAVAVNKIRLEVADHGRLPKLDAVLRYTMNGLAGDLGGAVDMQHVTGPFSWAAGFEFEVPLGNRAADAERRKRRLEFEQSLLEADRLAAVAIREVNVTVRAVQSAHEEVGPADRAKVAAEKALKGERVRFELGQITNEDLLRAQEILAAAERDRLRALLDFNLARTELGRAQGTLLEELGIEVVRPEEPPARRAEPLHVRFKEEERVAAAPAEK